MKNYQKISKEKWHWLSPSLFSINNAKEQVSNCWNDKPIGIGTYVRHTHICRELDMSHDAKVLLIRYIRKYITNREVKKRQEKKEQK